jgi:hypothetical protein
MGLAVADDGWRIPDMVWAQMEPVLPLPARHPLGCHNPRMPDRDAMNAILLVLSTEMQWNALNATGICSSSSAYRRFREWCGCVCRVVAAGAARLRRWLRDRVGVDGDGLRARQGAARRRAAGPQSH